MMRYRLANTTTLKLAIEGGILERTSRLPLIFLLGVEGFRPRLTLSSDLIVDHTRGPALTVWRGAMTEEAAIQAAILAFFAQMGDPLPAYLLGHA
jgi:hypothetical protein